MVQYSTAQHSSTFFSDHLPPFFPCKPLIEQRKDLGNVEMDIFQIQGLLVILLHFQQIVKLEIQLE